MGRPKRVVLREADFATPAEAHEYLAGRLGFPDYYGRNMSALADCLAEAGLPMLINVRIDPDALPPEMHANVINLVQVCAREALVNENVSLIIEHP